MYQVPPPPPAGSNNPLEVPVEWYVDVPTTSLSHVFAAVPEIQEQCLCSVSLVAGGDHRNPWARMVVFGKPLGIHKAVSKLKQVTALVEAGFGFEAPFPSTLQVPIDDLEDVVPVYHAAWTEFTSSRR